jgi:LysM repeat protein
MKRFPVSLLVLPLSATLALLASQSPLHAQNPAAEAAAAQEREERYQRLRTSIDDLQTAQATLQKRIAELGDEIQNVRRESEKSADKNAGQFVTRDELRALTDSVREIDRKREEDKKLILEEIRKLANTPVTVPEPPPRKATRPDPAPDAAADAPPVPRNGYTYVVKSGDTIEAIVKAYGQNGVKVTVDQVLKANPKLKPNAMRVKQKIFIPDAAAP